jgi:hypothetical protein
MWERQENLDSKLEGKRLHGNWEDSIEIDLKEIG